MSNKNAEIIQVFPLAKYIYINTRTFYFQMAPAFSMQKRADLDNNVHIYITLKLHCIGNMSILIDI